MKKTIYILSVLSVLVFNSAFGQKVKVSSAIKKYENLSYAESKDKLLDIATKSDSSAVVIEKLANAYYFNGEMEEASKWYQKLILMDSELESENYFRYAQALKAQKDYSKANEVLKTFFVKNPEDSRAKEFLNTPDYLNEINDLSLDFKLVNLDINTAFSDFGTSTYGGNLIFASSKDEGGKIYSWNDQPFLDLFKLNSDGTVNEVKGDVNTRYHESSTTYTKDGNTVYFTRNNFYKGKFKKNSKNTHALKIYKATLVDGEWTNIESLPFNNDEYSVAHPALSLDEKKLYFASDMLGTYGGSDIFVVDLNEDGTYGTPINLGAKINTEGRENFPFVSDKGVLYFSSDGHVGLGGLDVFKVENLEALNGVLNLGKPINSSKDDFAYIIEESTGKGYISSNREGGKGDDDIYSFVKPLCSKNITGIVVNKNTQQVLPNADVYIYDSNKSLVKTLKSDDKGRFDFALSCKEQTYLVEAKKDAYKDDFTDFSITKSKKSIVLKLALEPIPQVAALGTDLFKLLNLNPIYFDYDKSFIRADAEIELAKIIKYMNEFPNVKVDVRSHTDSRGRDAYNFALSNRRNKSTRAYIIDKGGISKDRLSGKGYGETQLTNHCSNGVKCSKAEHQANRRSEFIVVAN